RLLLGNEHLDLTPAPRRFAFAYGLDPLLGLDRPRARRLCLGLGRGLLARLVVDLDRALHARSFDRRFTGDLELAQLAVAQDARFVDAALRGDACALDFFAG